LGIRQKTSKWWNSNKLRRSSGKFGHGQVNGGSGKQLRKFWLAQSKNNGKKGGGYIEKKVCPGKEIAPLQVRK